jgi:hypothetical protein
MTFFISHDFDVSLEKTPFELARSIENNIIIKLVNKTTPCSNLYRRRPFGIHMDLFPSVPAGADDLHYIPGNVMNMCRPKT